MHYPLFFTFNLFLNQKLNFIKSNFCSPFIRIKTLADKPTVLSAEALAKEEALA